MSSLPENQFSRDEQHAMLALARAAIVSALEGKPVCQSPVQSAACFQRQGVFVTLEVYGKLRGCIGVVEPREPLWESIVHCAQSAAFSDPRFSPLRPGELHGLEIEISVLSELTYIVPGAIQIGKHGLLVAREDRRGLLLPQVAMEHHLSSEDFLSETCHKAGLPRDAWRDPRTEIYGFTCQIFREGQNAPVADGCS
jgi:AmmeMemoRadiSam system protein A